MANLTPVSRNDDVVMLELSDYVKGGPGGKSNQQAQQLLNKITWFDEHINLLCSLYTIYQNNQTPRVQNALNALLLKIETLKGKSDVTDVVATYTALQNYDTTKLNNNDIVKVLADETHDRMCAYYRWSTTNQVFTFIGTESIILPVVISSSSSVTPDDDYTYIITSGDLTLNSAYDGCIITVVATVACTVYYSSSSYSCYAGETIQFYYVNGSWILQELDLLNIAYPVGTVYISLNNVSPATFLGGTWTSLDSGKVLISSDSTNTGTTTGNSTVNISLSCSIGSHALTLAEMPSHGHDSVYVTTGGISSQHYHTYMYTSISVPSYGNSNVRWRRSTGSQNSGYISADHGHDTYWNKDGGENYSGGVTGANSAGHSHGTVNLDTFSNIDLHQQSMHVYMWRRTA